MSDDAADRAALRRFLLATIRDAAREIAAGRARMIHPHIVDLPRITIYDTAPPPPVRRRVAKVERKAVFVKSSPTQLSLL